MAIWMKAEGTLATAMEIVRTSSIRVLRSAAGPTSSSLRRGAARMRSLRCIRSSCTPRVDSRMSRADEVNRATGSSTQSPTKPQIQAAEGEPLRVIVFDM